MIPSTGLASFIGNLASLTDFDEETGGINRSEIDSQRRRSIGSGRADKKQQAHSVERYSNWMTCSKSKYSGSEQIRELM
jgi:hypothetical protein